ncbi:MAG: four helix bundle protein [Patescibacteria group bacterium]
MKLEEHYAYILGFELANDIWNIVSRWDYLAKDTIGKQLIRSADSISSNIAEGWFRYYKKDKILFYIYARGSVAETKDFIEKSKIRELISLKEYNSITDKLNSLPELINGLIKGTNLNLRR